MFWQFEIFLIKAIKLLLLPICFGCAWLLVALVIWSIWTSSRATFIRAKLMHRVPCTKCVFFTNDHRLKCTVHPDIANSESAIDCRDYQAKIDSRTG
jgi:hypothetical protein